MHELRTMEACRTPVTKMPHQGFARAWQQILTETKSVFGSLHDSVIMLEDDIVFAEGWLETLQSMQRGIAARGLRQGCASCFRPHLEPQSKVVELGGVPAYQSMAHTWHANLMPMSVLDNMEVLTESVDEVLASRRGLGLDVYYVGNLAHRLNRTSFVAMESWVAHRGYKNSLVSKQGFGNCQHPGVNLVSELSRFGEEYEKDWEGGDDDKDVGIE
jgi:hypothetical protein